METFLYILAGIIAGYFLARFIGSEKDDVVKSSSRVTTLPTPETGRFRSPFVAKDVASMDAAAMEQLCDAVRDQLNALDEDDRWLVHCIVNHCAMGFVCRAVNTGRELSTPMVVGVPETRQIPKMAASINRQSQRKAGDALYDR